MDDCLKRQSFYCHPGRAGGFPWRLIPVMSSCGRNILAATSSLHIAKSLSRSKKTPDRLFDQLLGLIGHGGRDDEPERL